jgi:ectoine hydroxylase-related dioxygenase (phytanoyl-CoA dioxygenase family)
MDLPFVEILKDENDPNYAKSFDINSDIDLSNGIEFMKQYGYVVFRNVYNSNECEETRDAMWSILEKQSATNDDNLVRDDPKTWSTFKSAGKYGLGTRGPCFDKVLVKNRQNPSLLKALTSIVDVPVNDLMVSHDRYTIYRATKLAENEIQCREFSTGPRNVHLDVNPWWWDESSNDVIGGVESINYDDPKDFIKENNLVVKSMGQHVQCVLNFADNHEHDGGTMIVPCFHNYYKQWIEKYKNLRKNIPWVQFIGYDNKLKDLCLEAEQKLLDRAQRIPMREGSVLIWYQIMFHGTSPNLSSRCRLGQFIKAFPRSSTFKSDIDKSNDNDTQSKNDNENNGIDIYTTKRLIKRAELLKKCLEEAGALDIVSEEGKSIFGLNVL